MYLRDVRPSFVISKAPDVLDLLRLTFLACFVVKLF